MNQLNLPVLMTICLGLSSIGGCQNTTDHPAASAHATPLEVGGRCEGCDAVLEAPANIGSVDTTIDFAVGSNRLLLKGRCLNSDGEPVEGVIVYIQHTDSTGVYRSNANDQSWAERHGVLRAWLKTGVDGAYALYTTMPASYPGSDLAAHVHFFVKEPCCTPYYLADVMFANDSLAALRTPENPRGGNGILMPLWDEENQLWVIERDIWLGLHVPDHPAKY